MPGSSSRPSIAEAREALRKLGRRSWAERAALVEATMVLALSRVAVLVVPFRLIAPRLGTHMEESPRDHDPGAAEAAERIGWAIGAVSRRVPWRSNCLEQAFAATSMLRRRGIESTMYLGLARPGDRLTRPVEAHAWVRSGSLHVTGGTRVDHYSVVAKFASSSSPKATRRVAASG